MYLGCTTLRGSLATSGATRAFRQEQASLAQTCLLNHCKRAALRSRMLRPEDRGLKHAVQPCQSCPSSSPSHINGLFTKATGLSLAWHQIRRSSFTPTSLYPQQRFTTKEDVLFWLLAMSNITCALAAQSYDWSARAFIMQHMRCSADAMYQERYYTLASSIFAHSSTIHCALNLLILYTFRRFQPLRASELAMLYVLGGLAGSASHVTYHWLDAGGLKYGPEFAINTPAYMGCSGAVAAVLAYKIFQAPAAMQLLVVLPLPVLLIELLYVALEIKEPAYLDGWPAKTGGAAMGLVCALLAAMTRRRVPPWLLRRK